MLSSKDIKEIKDKIVLLSKAIEDTEAEKNKWIKKLNEQKKELKKKRAELVKKIKWQEFYESHYIKKDYTTTKAYEMFGKRLKDLTKEERQEYNKIITREVRERNKKTI